MSVVKKRFERRTNRVRRSLKRVANGRPRLSIFRSSKHIYAQVIDDADGKTIVAASSLDQNLRKSNSKGCDVNSAQSVGKLVAERALKAGIKDVIFDRGGYLYHGRVKALADAAREGGLKF